MKVTVTLDDCTFQATLSPLPAAAPPPTPPATPADLSSIKEVSVVVPQATGTPKIKEVPEPLAGFVRSWVG